MLLQDFREGEMTTGTYYLAMLFRYKAEVEPLHLRDIGQELVKEERTLAALPGLIATRLLKVMTPSDEVVVGIVSDKKMPQQQQPQQQGQKPTDGIDPLRERLKAHVHLKDVALKGGPPIPPDIKTLILYKPEALSPADVFKLDQFLMRGGRVIVLLDTYSTFDYDKVSVTDQALQQQKFSLRPIETGLKDWLAFYGMDVLPGVVMDRFNHKMIRSEPVPGTPIPRQELADMPGLMNVREHDANKKSDGPARTGRDDARGDRRARVPASDADAGGPVDFREASTRDASLDVLVRSSQGVVGREGRQRHRSDVPRDSAASRGVGEQRARRAGERACSGRTGPTRTRRRSRTRRRPRASRRTRRSSRWRRTAGAALGHRRRGLRPRGLAAGVRPQPARPQHDRGRAGDGLQLVDGPEHGRRRGARLRARRDPPPAPDRPLDRRCSGEGGPDLRSSSRTSR